MGPRSAVLFIGHIVGVEMDNTPVFFVFNVDVRSAVLFYWHIMEVEMDNTHIFFCF